MRLPIEHRTRLIKKIKEVNEATDIYQFLFRKGLFWGYVECLKIIYPEFKPYYYRKQLKSGKELL